MKSYVLAATVLALVCQNAHAEGLESTAPAGGGNISIVTTNGPIQAGGIEFVAEPGILIQGESPAPFLSLIHI